jgi:hypothetical protein
VGLLYERNKASLVSEHTAKDQAFKALRLQAVEARLDGLLFNVNRDLQRLLNELTAHRQWHKSHRLVGISVAVMFTKNSYNSSRYLIADTPEDHQRRPNYVLVLPASIGNYLIFYHTRLHVR